MSYSLRIAVLWRPGRNVEMQQAFSGEAIADDAQEEAELLRDGLADAGHHAFLVQWRRDDIARTLYDLRRFSVDLVFNASSDQEVCLLHAAGIPYCGSGPDLVTTSKATRKKILMYAGLRTSPFVVIGREGKVTGGGLTLEDLRRGWEPRKPLQYPLFVKPIAGRGSSGVSDDSIVYDLPSLIRQVEMIVCRLGQGALVENYLVGQEVTVGIIGDPPVALTPLEIEYNGAKTNTYEHKMDKEIMHCPARLSPLATTRVQDTARRVFDVLGARDFARVDTIVDKEGLPHVLEINTFAGLHILTGIEKRAHASYIGVMAKASGLSRAALLDAIASSAMTRSRRSAANARP